MLGSLPTWITILKLYERSPSSSSTVISPRSSPPTKTSALSEPFGTTRMCALPKSFFKYPSSFLTSWTSNGALLLEATFACPIEGRSASAMKTSAVQHQSVEHLVHRARRLGAARLADDLGRHAGNRDIVRHRLDHDRARRDTRAMADLDIAQNLRARADHHAAADFRMTVLMLLAGAAERDVMQDRHVVLDDGGLTDDEAGRMVEENAAADLRRRIDVALEDRGRAALQVKRKILAALAIEPVREAMRLDGVKALIVEHGLDEAAGSRIAVDGRDDVGAEGLAEDWLVL